MGAKEVKMKIEKRLRMAVRRKGFSYRTEECYAGWYKRYVHFHGLRHPETMGVPEIEAFLNHLAVNRAVAPSTQNQAFSALLFLYEQVLGMKLEGINARRAKERKRLPVDHI